MLSFIVRVFFCIGLSAGVAAPLFAGPGDSQHSLLPTNTKQCSPPASMTSMQAVEWATSAPPEIPAVQEKTTFASQADGEKQLPQTSKPGVSDIKVPPLPVVQPDVLPAVHTPPSESKPAPRFGSDPLPPIKSNDLFGERHSSSQDQEQAERAGASSPTKSTPPTNATSKISKWTVHVEVLDEVTHLVARSKETEFRVQCKVLKMQSPSGDIQAEGGISVTVAGLKISCDQLTISWQDDWVSMSGKVAISTQRDGHEVNLQGNELRLRLTTLAQAATGNAEALQKAAIQIPNGTGNGSEKKSQSEFSSIPSGSRPIQPLIRVQPSHFPEGVPVYYRRVTK